MCEQSQVKVLACMWGLAEVNRPCAQAASCRVAKETNGGNSRQ